MECKVKFKIVLYEKLIFKTKLQTKMFKDKCYKYFIFMLYEKNLFKIYIKKKSSFTNVLSEIEGNSNQKYNFHWFFPKSWKART
jgi:hypothetical protein